MTTVTRPACLHVPPGVAGSYVDDVADLMHLAGRDLHPHQLIAVEALTSHVRGGRWPTLEAGVEGPRQTVGKTGGILLPIALTLSLIFEPDERVWTAHRLDTTGSTFTDAQRLLGVEGPQHSWDDHILGRRVAGVALENGNEHIEFRNGARLRFKARGARAGRGLSGNDIFLDEWLFGNDEITGALFPVVATRSAQGSPRLWYGSSSAKDASYNLRRLRRRAVREDNRLVWVGWWASGSWAKPGCAREDCTHAVGSPGCSLDDQDLWLAANPGVPSNTSLSFLEDMRRTLSPLEFGREFMGWQEGGDGNSPISLEIWEALGDPESRPLPSPVWLGLDTGKGLSSAAISAAAYREDGLAHVEVLRYGTGFAWAVDYLAEKARTTGARVRLLGGSATAIALAGQLERAGVNLDPVDASDYAAACTLLQAYVDGGRLRHLGDPLLASVLEGAVGKDTGDAGGWRWSPRESVSDTAPLVAMTLALGALASGASMTDYDPLDSIG